MIQHLTGGAWTMASRRLLEAATRNLPLMALLFLPIWFNLATLYPWVSPNPNDEAMQEVLHLKGAYLNANFFGLRARCLLRRSGSGSPTSSTGGRDSRTNCPRSCPVRSIAARECCRARDLPCTSAPSRS